MYIFDVLCCSLLEYNLKADGFSAVALQFEREWLHNKGGMLSQLLLSWGLKDGWEWAVI